MRSLWMKCSFYYALVAIAIPNSAVACFSFEKAYAENLENAQLYLVATLLLLMMAWAACLVRRPRRKSLFIAISATLVVVHEIFYQWVIWGSGDCGYGFVEAAPIAAKMALGFAAYEFVVTLSIRIRGKPDAP